MGSSRIEVVHDMGFASLRPSKYDAIVYEDGVVPFSVRQAVTIEGSDCICAGPDWVYDCLLTGSFLRLRET